MFGGGTAVIVSDPAALLRTKAEREALQAVFASVAPGNGLAFVELTEGGGGRRSAALVGLEGAIAAAGGETREFKAPQEGRLAAWIEARAGELEVRLAAGAAKELATRVGGFVHEGDVDRRRQGQIAVGELEKLALYRTSGEVTVEDVRALVPEAVPGSLWALADAVGGRRAERAAEILDRLLGATHELVILAALHRRVRELVDVADRLADGQKPSSIPRALGLHPFRAEQLVLQARAWTVDELVAALHGLLDLDATMRGAPGMPASDAQRRLAFTLWLADLVAPGDRRTRRGSTTGSTRD
jgi:DNA polymerase III delta subunit